jgi:hypothetical protein
VRARWPSFLAWASSAICKHGDFHHGLGRLCDLVGLKRDLRRKGYKENATFRVTPETIKAAGKTFKKEDIHRILIRNGISDQEVSASGNIEMTVSGAQAAGMMYRARVGAIANGLCVETGGKATIIAGGMDATTAFGLLTDVSRILGFSYPEFA